MLRKRAWLKSSEYLEDELQQAEDEGRDVRFYRQEVKTIQAMDQGDPERERLAADLLDRIAATHVREDYYYIEPSDLFGIKEARPDAGKNLKLDLPRLTEAVMFDKVYGAWLGRCAGCLLGQPIEGWHRNRIIGLLKDTGNYPFHYYISSDVSESLRKQYEIEDEAGVYGGTARNWINNVLYMPEDDDINYTLIGLKVFDKYGPDFTPDDVAETWLSDLPILHVCTAERVAYKNLVNGIYPPESANFRNPYREWIGAQIRADFFGYVTPGNPALGAEMAWRDASISHIKNGIYGELLIAAMLSTAAVTNCIDTIIETGLSQIPEKSRLTKAVRTVLKWKSEGLNWEQSIDRLHQMYDEKLGHHWCHAISNAMIVCIGLLYGETDFEKSIGIAVSSAFDTDCNGATVGSIIGMILGASAMPKKWIEPLNNQMKSGVAGFSLVRISEVAQLTMDCIKKLHSQFCIGSVKNQDCFLT